MVLENASDSVGADSFTENPPASDDDPYSSSIPQAGPLNYNIDTSSLPKPIPILGPLLGYNEQLFMKVLQGKLNNGAKALKRTPTQDEANAFAFWTAKQISIFSYGAPLGIAGGLWRAYGTAGTFRFPFWQPNLEKLEPNVFPSQRMAMFKGNRAVMAWHAVRMLAYGAVGNWVGQLLFGSYSMSVAAVGELSDPRLKGMVEAIRSQAQQKRGGLPASGQAGIVGSQQRGGLGDGNAPPADDASPTGGMFSEESAGFGDSDGETSDDKRAGIPASRWPQQSNPQPPQGRYTETRDQPFDAFDDASPTGGVGARTDTLSKQQGSAWDRIREDSKIGSTPSKPSQSAWSKRQNNTNSQVGQQEGSTDVDEYFSRPENEKLLAQKAFDEKVDRERRGGDFSSGSGDQKRW